MISKGRGLLTGVLSKKEKYPIRSYRSRREGEYVLYLVGLCRLLHNEEPPDTFQYGGYAWSRIGRWDENPHHSLPVYIYQPQHLSKGA